MTPEALIIAIPLWFVGLVVLFDVLARRDLPPVAKAGWIVAVIVVWPMMIAYLLLRPVKGRFLGPTAVRRNVLDDRADLVAACFDRRAGRISKDEFDTQVTVLRDRS